MSFRNSVMLIARVRYLVIDLGAVRAVGEVVIFNGHILLENDLLAK